MTSRAILIPSDSSDDVAATNWRTTPEAGLASSPEAAVRLREAHLERRLALIARLGYPSMGLLSK